MVVVAIIGILASLGIPQFNKFQAKARQSESKGYLSAIFSGEATFLSEWNVYTVSLKNIGVGPQGQQLRYTGGFPNTTTCTNYAATNPNAPGENGANTNQLNDALVNTGGAGWYGTVTSVAAPVGDTCDATAAAQAFTAVIYGQPNNNSITMDVWTINQQKTILNTSPGIN